MVLLILALILVACGGAQAPPSGATSPPPSGIASSGPSEAPADDAIAVLLSDLRSTGADVRELGGFNPDPLGGRGVNLCVAGQKVSVYVFDSREEREAVSARIDPNDPSNLGATIIEWAGQPKFWQRDRLLLLYLGSDPGVEAGLTSVLGQPFARGQGRDPGQGRHGC